MKNRSLFPGLLLILCLIFLSCILITREPILPTSVPTAVVVSPNFTRDQQNSSVSTLILEKIPTASPTSPPTPTNSPFPETSESFPDPTPLSDLGSERPTNQVAVPTITAQPTAVATTPVPTVPTQAAPTNTSTPLQYPKPPEILWPPFSIDPSLPVSTRPRHGVALALGGAPADAYGGGGYSWTFSWSPYVSTEQSTVQHVPMLAASPRSNLPPYDYLVERDGYTDHNYWLVFNECEHQRQCNSSPEEAARFFHDEIENLMFTEGADADADLIVGGVNAHPCGILWLKQFVDYYRNTYGSLQVAGWHFHLYPEMRPSGWPGSCDGGWGFDDTLFPNPEAAFNIWRDHAENALAFVEEYGSPNDEIWFTEIGCLNNGFHQIQAPVCQVEGFVQDYAWRILDWLNSDGRWVSRYAWYTNWDTTYWVTTHLLAEVPLGEQWTYSSLGYWYSQIIPAASVPLP